MDPVIHSFIFLQPPWKKQKQLVAYIKHLKFTEPLPTLPVQRRHMRQSTALSSPGISRHVHKAVPVDRAPGAGPAGRRKPSSDSAQLDGVAQHSDMKHKTQPANHPGHLLL